jgi:ATP-dependent RNA/DNA helicase IGHMBP2
VFNLIDSRIRQEDIAVITPYNLQLELIKAKLHTKFPLVEVKSVDGFQGREKEAIVLSLVRSNSRGEVGFLGDQRRINVAITRARRHLAVVCDSQTCKSNAFLKSFLDYCDKNADMRSGFDYVNENLVVAGGDDDGDNEFEDVTFSKLKVSDKAKKKQSAGKKPQSTGKNDLTSTEEKERQFRDEVTRIINKLDMEKNTEHAFSHDLNSFQRRIVHELAEQFKLYHESRGEAEKRFIVISTRDFNNEKVAAGAVSVQVQAETVNSGFKIEPLLENNEKQKPLAEVKEDTVAQTIGNNKFEVLMDQNTAKGANKNKKQKEGAKQPSADAFLNKKKEDKSATVHLLGELEDQTSSDLKFRSDCRKCVNCDKFILNSNFTMHELHCLKQQTRKQPVDTVLASGSKKSSSVAASSEKTYTAVTKKDKVKKNPIEAAETDDFDTLLDMFQKTNNVCNFVGCKTLVKTLGQNCEFCNFRFCLSHSLAEVKLFFFQLIN